MAAKLILSMDGAVIKEYLLNKERITIGRRAHNDIVIDNLAVSGEHAAVVTILHDSFLEDLDSTNGLEVNGKPTKKHFLQNNDLIEIGKYKLKYINDQISPAGSADYEKTMVLREPVKHVATLGSAVQKEVVEKTGKFETYKPAAPAAFAQAATPARSTASSAAPQTAAPKQLAVVQILTGPNAGKELELVKNLTTLGKPGMQVAVLTRRPQGVFITHVEGENFPSVNGQVITNQAHQLNDHDVIELAGVKMEFYFKG